MSNKKWLKNKFRSMDLFGKPIMLQYGKKGEIF